MKVSRLEGDSYSEWSTEHDDTGSMVLLSAVVLVICVVGSALLAWGLFAW